jgi:CBS domain-containing protein
MRPFLFPQPVGLAVSVPRVGHVVKTVAMLPPAATVRQVAVGLRQHGMGALPIGEAGFLLGWVTDSAISAVLATGGASPDVRAGDLLEVPPALVDPAMPAAELCELFASLEVGALPVVAVDGRYLGMITRAETLAAAIGVPTPPRLGGMATPLGVYLTTGSVSGGAGDLGLVLTGGVLTLLLWVGQALALLLPIGLWHLTRRPEFLDVGRALLGVPILGDPRWQLLCESLATFWMLAIFLLLLRWWPRMAGLHAAEHQTVNAIEAGEPLTLEAVAAQSRVHPRCGTNLWGILSLANLGILCLMALLATPVGQANLGLVSLCVLWMVLLLAVSWRRIGTWLQTHWTTRRASPAELASGIRAGREVLARHWATPPGSPPPAVRLWRMGLLQVVLGLIVMSLFQDYANQLLYAVWHSLVK